MPIDPITCIDNRVLHITAGLHCTEISEGALWRVRKWENNESKEHNMESIIFYMWTAWRTLELLHCGHFPQKETLLTLSPCFKVFYTCVCTSNVSSTNEIMNIYSKVTWKTTGSQPLCLHPSVFPWCPAATAAPPTVTSLLMFLSSDWLTRRPALIKPLCLLFAQQLMLIYILSDTQTLRFKKWPRSPWLLYWLTAFIHTCDLLGQAGL